MTNVIQFRPSPKLEPRSEQQNARTLGELTALARKRGYRNPEWWAKRILLGRKKGGKS